MSQFLKNPDEIVLENIKMFHYEVMNENDIWMGIYTNDGKIYHLTVHGNQLQVHYRDETP